MTEEKYILGKKQTDVLCIQTHFRKRQILKTDRYILGKRQIDGKTARGKCFVCHILVGDIHIDDRYSYIFGERKTGYSWEVLDKLFMLFSTVVWNDLPI